MQHMLLAMRSVGPTTTLERGREESAAGDEVGRRPRVLGSLARKPSAALPGCTIFPPSVLRKSAGWPGLKAITDLLNLVRMRKRSSRDYVRVLPQYEQQVWMQDPENGTMLSQERSA